MKEISKAIAGILNSQTTTVLNKSIQCIEHDGLVCDGKHHTKLYEDEIIRILDVVVPAGEDEPFHTHELPSVMYLDMPARIEYSIPSKVVFTSPANKEREPHVSYLEPEGLHKVKNIDEIVFRAFRIEIKFDIDLHACPTLDVQLKNEIEKHKSTLDQVRAEILRKELNEKLDQASTAVARKNADGICPSPIIQISTSELPEKVLDLQRTEITTAFHESKLHHFRKGAELIPSAEHSEKPAKRCDING